MADLIVVGDVTERLTSLTTQQLNLLPSLISKASQAIEATCRRSFVQAERVIYGKSFNKGEIQLQSPPVTEIITAHQFSNTLLSVSPPPHCALSLKWSNATDLWESRYPVSLRLRLTNGTEQLITLAENITIASVVSQINAISGWSATANGDSTAPSSRLGDGIGSGSGKAAKLEFPVFDEWLRVEDVQTSQGVYSCNTITKYRIVYISGFTAVPQSIKEIAFQTVSAMLKKEELPTGVKKIMLGDLTLEFGETEALEHFKSLKNDIVRNYKFNMVL